MLYDMMEDTLLHFAVITFHGRVITFCVNGITFCGASMSERKMRLFGHIVRKNGMEKRLMQGKMEGKRRRGRPATTWFQDLKEWTKLDIAGASQLAIDRERWRKIIKVTAAQIAPPD